MFFQRIDHLVVALGIGRLQEKSRAYQRQRVVDQAFGDFIVGKTQPHPQPRKIGNILKEAELVVSGLALKFTDKENGLGLMQRDGRASAFCQLQFKLLR